jgi:Fe-S-cluster containining protein
MIGSLFVLNLSDVKYECTFGRGCDGACCQAGRPPIYPEEKENLDAHLDLFLPHLRPEAQKLIASEGYLGRRQKLGLPMLRVTGGWCVFFNRGCVLHTLGAEEGDKHRYKPAACALFPLARDEHDRWYVRQQGYLDEKWDLFCLSPQASSVPAEESLHEETELALRYDEIPAN